MNAVPLWIEALRDLPLAASLGVSLAINILVFFLSLALGEILTRAFPQRRCSPLPAPLTAFELLLASSCVLLNTLVMWAGILLYRAGIIEVSMTLTVGRVLADLAILFVAMDAAMYALHRVAHHPWLFPLLHRHHHAYTAVRPLTLFVLNPFEVLGFGGLWLVVVSLYPATWLGITLYLIVNTVFGTIGHLGVEPFPRWWGQRPTHWITTSTFHATHHDDLDHNFGFYTEVWDRLFGTAAQALTPPSGPAP